MIIDAQWRSLGWRHAVWDLVRYYCSLRGKEQQAWLAELADTKRMKVGTSEHLPIDPADIQTLIAYLATRKKQLELAMAQLRTEEEAIAFCQKNKVLVGKTATQNAEHHQSSKALVDALAFVAGKVCAKKGTTVEPNPQRRCVWCVKNGLHVTARNLDGAIPSLANPTIIWEIKEYWGKTKGGSKMSDAVYECNLVGRELREFEERTGISVTHAVFVDGKEQWSVRKSDLARFIDLSHQGIIDYLFVGREVEVEWEKTLLTLLA